MLRQSLTREVMTAVSATGKSATLESNSMSGSGHEAGRTVRAFVNQSVGQVLFGITRDGNVVSQ